MTDKQFKEQGGAATMDPNPVRRWLISKMMTRMSSHKLQQKERLRVERQRVKAKQDHVVEYFHLVNDGYSHLAVQLLEVLQQRYQIQLQCHIVSDLQGANSPEPKLLLDLSRYDATLVAPYYGLQAPDLSSTNGALPEPRLVEQATSMLAGLENQAFIEKAAVISSALWREGQNGLDSLGALYPPIGVEQVSERIDSGNTRRSQLAHYSGAMFYYGGEWYWGVDRLYHLEQRLAELGLDRTPNEPLLAPRPEITAGPLIDSGKMTLEVFPSLRSPYTAIVFDRTVKFAKDSGLELKVKPVLPMVMRGVPATIEKGKYILFDTGREARAANVPFGPCADPIGEPTRRAYSLYSWAQEQGRAIEFISAFLRCAWVDAVNTNTDKGMREVVERAGLDWSHASQIIGKCGWESDIEANRLAMYELGLWGVPSYRLLDENGNQILAVWGQDRMWLVAKEVQHHLQSIASSV